MDRTSHRREKLSDDRSRPTALDALLVASVTNVRYLTGFTGDSSALLLTRDRAVDHLRRPLHDPARSRNAPTSRSTSGRSASR